MRSAVFITSLFSKSAELYLIWRLYCKIYFYIFCLLISLCSFNNVYDIFYFLIYTYFIFVSCHSNQLLFFLIVFLPKFSYISTVYPSEFWFQKLYYIPRQSFTYQHKKEINSVTSFYSIKARILGFFFHLKYFLINFFVSRIQ